MLYSYHPKVEIIKDNGSKRKIFAMHKQAI